MVGRRTGRGGNHQTHVNSSGSYRYRLSRYWNASVWGVAHVGDAIGRIANEAHFDSPSWLRIVTIRWRHAGRKHGIDEVADDLEIVDDPSGRKVAVLGFARHDAGHATGTRILGEVGFNIAPDREIYDLEASPDLRVEDRVRPVRPDVPSIRARARCASVD